MSENLNTLDKIYQGMYIAVLIILAVMLFACLIRAVKGPRIADRIVAVNMMGTMVMVMIAVLSLLLKEGFLIDICLIYALVSFLAVTVISKVYIGVYAEKRQALNPEAEEESAEGNKEGDDLLGNS
ncbi:MAG: sodium:proton antiporter [Lachnospiraceae bacterium]|nr:sodium:proton antiporter [Lachnospiraceae bacterium]MDE7285411.1 sodium:proton antiporter [Lachnospiraceae bacterium]